MVLYKKEKRGLFSPNLSFGKAFLLFFILFISYLFCTSQTHAATGQVQISGAFNSTTLTPADGTAANTNANANAIAIGNESSATDAHGIAVGFRTQAALRSVALVEGAQAANYGVAIGSGAEAQAEYSIAIGSESKAVGQDSISIGADVTASDANSIAMGQNAATTGDDSIAIGHSSVSGESTDDLRTVAIGNSSTATGLEAIAIGHNAHAHLNFPEDSRPMAVGNNAEARGASATALGNYATAGAASTSGMDTAVGGGAKATGAESTALGYDAQATGYSGTAVGVSSRATGEESTALGYYARATGDRSTALGYSAQASAYKNIAIGDAAKALNPGSYAETGAIAIGSLAEAQNGRAISIGAESSAALGSVAIGDSANGQGEGSVTLGTEATSTAAAFRAITIGNQSQTTGSDAISIGPYYYRATSSTGDRAVSLGAGAQATATHAVALGTSASASHDNSVALGIGSATIAANSVSVGSGNAADAYQYRRITHVADPVDAHDAATKGYVDAQVINAMGIDAQGMRDEINKMDRRISNVGAMQMAVANAQVQVPEGKNTAIGVGIGSYQGSKAATVGLTHRLPGLLKGFQFSGNFTVANAGEKAGGVGFGYTF